MIELDDEVDLKHYVRVIQRSWKLILGLMVVTTAAAATARLILPRSFTASTLVSVGQPPYAVRLEQVNQDPALLPRSYQDLALSDDVIANVLAQAQTQYPNKPFSVLDLRDEMAASSASDPTLMRLAVTDSDPARAAAISNIWAAAVADRAAVLYGPGTAQLESYKTQLADAKAGLTKADQALTAFQAQNQDAVVAAQLSNQRSSLTDYLQRQHRFTLLQQDAQDLLARLQKLDPQQPANATDETALLLLIAQALNAKSAASGPDGAGADIPIQIQIGTDSASKESVGQLVAGVQSFIDASKSRASDAQVQAAKLTPSILALQGQNAEIIEALHELTRTQSLVESQYLTLAAKVDQVEIAAQDAGTAVKIVSRAAIPQKATGFGLTLVTLAGACAGLLAGVLVTLSRDWLRVADRPSLASKQAPQPGAVETNRTDRSPDTSGA